MTKYSRNPRGICPTTTDFVGFFVEVSLHYFAGTPCSAWCYREEEVGKCFQTVWNDHAESFQRCQCNVSEQSPNGDWIHWVRVYRYTWPSILLLHSSPDSHPIGGNNNIASSDCFNERKYNAFAVSKPWIWTNPFEVTAVGAGREWVWSLRIFVTVCSSIQISIATGGGIYIG